jgi:hypothetical protein
MADELKKAIKDAANDLRYEVDADWTEGGRPSLKRIQALTKNSTITQDQVDEALPDVKRINPKAEILAKDNEPATKGKTILPRRSGIQGKKEVQPDMTEKEAAEAAGFDWLDGELVIADERGFYGGMLREEGEAFVFTGAYGSWFHKATAAERKAYTKERREDD